MVEHQVDNHASYRDIEPQRQGKAGNFPVSHKVRFQSSIERDPYQRDYYDRQSRVANEDGEIDRSHQAHSGKPRGSVLIMISEVGREKDRGHHDRCYLARAMGRHASSTNERIA